MAFRRGLGNRRRKAIVCSTSDFMTGAVEIQEWQQMAQPPMEYIGRGGGTNFALLIS